MDRVGRYEIREKIGQGAMASVYLGFDPQINRPIAIKLLHEDFCGDASHRSRFVDDAAAAGRLSHPNIVTVFDAGEHYSQPYIAMELVEGRTLSDILKEEATLPLGTIIEIGIQLARALDYAHTNGIVHRDVKPGNIMLLKNSTRLKVVDFGICRIENTDRTQHTRLGEILGTPNYMAPEQVMGSRVDGRADLFAVGVVLYELLTGKKPFRADTMTAVAMQIINVEPAPIDKLRPDLPLALRRVVDRCLRKSPEKRYQTGAELAKDLVAVARELKETGQSKSRPRRPSLGLRWALTMFGLVAVTMIVTTAYIRQRQGTAMLNQAIGYGATLAKFMASQNAEAVLGEDWPTLEVFIQNASDRQGFNHLEIIDHQGTIRGSTRVDRIGMPYILSNGEPVDAEGIGVMVHRQRAADGQNVLDFAAPVLFQGKDIGAVHLGIYETPLTKVADLTLFLLAILIIVTSSSVALASYLLARQLVLPLRVLRNSLEELGKGRYDYRIKDRRRDEFGELYSAFDATAAALQQRHEADPTADA